MRGRVAMLVKNSFEYDARVRKEGASLTADGWQVTVVALQVPGVTAARERTPEGVEVIRVTRLYGRLAGLAGPSTTTPGQRSASRRTRAFLRPALEAVRPMVRALNDRVVDRRMIAAATSLRPDVVHAHDLNTLTPARAAARPTAAALVYDAHELHRGRSGATARQRHRAHRKERRLVRAASLVITATDTWADMLATDSVSKRPLVIRNFPELAATAMPAKDLRARIGISVDTPLLVYQGSIQQGRGIAVTLEALISLPECHLAVIGYGAYRPTVESVAQRLGVSDRVHFTGPVPNAELIAWTRGADVGLCLIEDISMSYRTSLPNKLFEYIHAGVAVVASDFPEMEAIVRRTGCGEVCDPADLFSVVKALRAVLGNQPRYANAARRAADEYVWETEVTGLIDAYRDLTNRRDG